MYNDAVHTEESGDLRLQLFYDENATSPRENACNVGTFAAFHRRYELGDTSDVVDAVGRAMDRWNNWQLTARYLRMFHGATVVLPVGLVDHSMLHLYIGGGSHLSDPGGWDSGTVGLIFDTHAMREATGMVWEMTLVPEQIEACLRDEIEELDRYVQGDVYGYVIDRATTCILGDTHYEMVDSCWGYVGEKYALESARDALEGA